MPKKMTWGDVMLAGMYGCQAVGIDKEVDLRKLKKQLVEIHRVANEEPNDV